MDLRRDVGPRLALALGVVLGLYSALSLWRGRPGMLAANYEVYYYAADAALSGRGFYDVAPPEHGAFYYLYPPATVLVFVPYALVGSIAPGFAVHTVLGVATGVVLGLVAARYVERAGHDLTWVDYALLVGFATASLHAVPSLYYGNLNVQLALVLAVGLVALERDREWLAGGLLAVPALFKAFPALTGLWLLRRRAWRAVAGAVATAAATFLVGTAAFGLDAHRTYLFDALLPRRRTDVFAGGMPPDAAYVTLRQPLSYLLPDSPGLLGPLAALLLAPVVADAYRDCSTRVDRLVAVYVTLAATLLVLSSYFVYYVYLFFPLLPLLYLLPGRPGDLFAAGAGVAAFAYGRDVVFAWIRNLPPGLADPLVAALRPVLLVGNPPLYGTLLTLVACVWYCRDRGGAGTATRD